MPLVLRPASSIPGLSTPPAAALRACGPGMMSTERPFGRQAIAAACFPVLSKDAFYFTMIVDGPGGSQEVIAAFSSQHGAGMPAPGRIAITNLFFYRQGFGWQRASVRADTTQLAVWYFISPEARLEGRALKLLPTSRSSYTLVMAPKHALRMPAGSTKLGAPVAVRVPAARAFAASGPSMTGRPISEEDLVETLEAGERARCSAMLDAFPGADAMGVLNGEHVPLVKDPSCQSGWRRYQGDCVTGATGVTAWIFLRGDKTYASYMFSMQGKLLPVATDNCPAGMRASGGGCAPIANSVQYRLPPRPTPSAASLIRGARGM